MSPEFDPASTDTIAESAVYAAIRTLVSSGKRPYHLNVPLTAARILYERSQGSLDESEASQRVRAAINGLSKRGAIQISLHGAQSWKILIDEKVAMEQSKVFIVHGRDDAAKNEVARFVEKLGLQAVVLHEVASKGRTIISKFRDEAHDVVFAIVLMTPDDEGGPKGESFKPRARQNVIFELGFFIGKLGPEKVVALVRKDLERPSDYDGVVYVGYDGAGAWKQELAREMKAASVNFDVEKLVGS